MRVAAIHIAPGRRLPTRSVDTVVAEAGKGLIGDVELEVVRVAAPCRLLDDWIGAGAMAAMRGRAGSAFRVLTSGTIGVGDLVRIEAAAAP